MATVVSAYTYTIVDQMGNPRTEAWLTLEYGESYVVGGVAFDLSPYFRRLEHVVTEWMSGGTLRAPASGYGILSGQAFQSGTHVKAVPVFEDYSTPASARFQLHGVIGGNNPISGVYFTGIREVGSGALAAAVSGVRFLARAIGY
jgi:hypothetical protein